MKTKIRMLCLCMCLLFVLPVFAACSGKEDPPVQTEPPASPSGEQTGEPNVLDGVKFDGETLKVLSWIPSNVVEYVATYSAESDDISRAVYLRNSAAKEQLGLEVSWSEIPGNGAAMDSYLTSVRNSHNAGAGVGSDIYCCYSLCAATMLTEGILSNLGSMQYMDFEQPFWPTDILEDMAINDNLYFCTGDISTNLIFMTSMVFFNKKIVEDHNINATVEELYGEPDLYSLVRNKKWTLDAMFSLCEGIYSEMGDAQSTADDLYGFGTYNTLLDNFYYCTGATVIETGNGLFNVSETFTNVDLMSTLLAKVGAFLHDSGEAYYYNGYQAARDAFSNSKNLFSLAPASHAYVTHSKTNGLRYGVLPVPMYDENCTDYSSVHSFPYSMFGVESNSALKEQAGAYLQALGERSYSTTRVTIFEQTMKGRYSNDEPDAEMWDIIIASQTFDIGRIFSTMFGSNTSESLTVLLFRNSLASGSSNWQAVMASNQQLLQAYADRIYSNLRQLS